MKPLDELVDGYLRIDSAQPLSGSLVRAVNDLCDRAEDADRDLVLVLHVIGRHAITSDRSWPGEVGIDLVSKWERALRRLERLNAVTIAVAERTCWGPTLNVLLAADYRIGAPDLRLSIAGGERELWPGMAVHRLANQIGVARSRQMVLFGVQVTAARAWEIGLLDDVTDDLAAAVSAAADLAGGLTGAELAIRRRLLLDAANSSFEDSLGAHLAACDRTLRLGAERPAGPAAGGRITADA
ncbi:enoyl-CoA-hydratase DpgB [Kutzneria sp. CA-103260]|uniref:enoyl-CoA-hydratase DpgB n=1 Tax=Kutzneria sp. CA-103260 TaxID=2802641 RepID=UPI001BF038AF|nr:enoyl-CoA-hydratase DpgB [Kutzneria sp. CA-103260]QUQ65304.1 Enoyl-CoA-hydratase [Kutzneria sp. CA-103260]